jgi:hypothetical protein
MAHRMGCNPFTMAEILIARRIDATRGTAGRRRADAGAALVAGVAAGSALLTLLVLLSVGLYDEPAWKIPQMIGALLRGPDAAALRVFDPALAALGVAVHFTLSLLYALAFAGLTVDLRRNYALAGMLFGATLYLANFHGFTQLFPWFLELRTPDTLAAQAFYGLLLACIYKDACAVR